MKPSLDALLPIIYRYYPRGMNEYDPGYKETEEHQRLVRARIAAVAEGNPWSVLLDRLYGRFTGIHNGSIHLPTGGWDAGYVGRMALAARWPHEVHHEISFLVSFIAPYYVLYSSSIFVAPTPDSSGRSQEIRFTFAPEEEPHARAITEEILSVFPDYGALPAEIGNMNVPDVVAGNQAMGQATLFHCLFTDAW